jgi:FecR protein
VNAISGVLSGVVLGLALLNGGWGQTCLAQSEIEIVRQEGSVVIERPVNPSGASPSAANPKGPMTVKTGPDGRAVIRLGTDGVLVIAKNSAVEIPGLNFIRQLSGMIYYAIRSRNSDNQRLLVKTPILTIGIRGTRFLVADTASLSEIGVRKGQISLDSDRGEFEIHKKSESTDFEDYKREGELANEEQQKEFDRHKTDIRREFVEFKKQLELPADRMVKIVNGRVEELRLSGETEMAMEIMEEFGRDWIEQVRD